MSSLKSLAQRLHISDQWIPFLATCFTFVLLYSVASVRYDGFFSLKVFLDLITDNAFLGIAAIGMTFVILSGGIDLSVGSVVALSSILLATLVEKQGMNPLAALALILLLGAVLGAIQGFIISFFELAPFLVTLAGMFFARGLGLVIGVESLQLNHPLLKSWSLASLPLTETVGLPITGLTFLILLSVAVVILASTRYGRSIYAVGGQETSSQLMGLNVKRTKVSIYATSGFCSALAGIVYSIYTSSGNASAANGLELDAIAAVVIGGSLLTGGSGYVLGTLIGVLILGIIQTATTFENTLSSWWTRILVGSLFFVFILLQRFFTSVKGRKRVS